MTWRVIIVSRIEGLPGSEAQLSTVRSRPEIRLLVARESTRSIRFVVFIFFAFRLQVIVHQLEVFSTIAPIRRRELHLERGVGVRPTRAYGNRRCPTKGAPWETDTRLVGRQRGASEERVTRRQSVSERSTDAE